MHIPRRLLPLTLTTVAVLGVFAACGEDDDNNGDDPTGSSTSTVPGGASGTATSAPGVESPTPVETAAPGEEGIPFETPSTLFSKDGSGMGTATLADVRTGRNEGFDRVVIEFDGDELPGYEVGYVQSIAQCGSGEAVDFAAPVTVSVTVQPASAHNDAGEATVAAEIPTQGTAAVQEVLRFCDFEGVVGYGIGLSGARPFRVFELEGPPRLVIDFSQ